MLIQTKVVPNVSYVLQILTDNEDLAYKLKFNQGGKVVVAIKPPFCQIYSLTTATITYQASSSLIFSFPSWNQSPFLF